MILLFFAAPASFFSAAANSQVLAASFSHFFMNEAFAAPASFFSVAAAVHVAGAAVGVAVAWAKAVKLVKAAMRMSVDLIN